MLNKLFRKVVPFLLLSVFGMGLATSAQAAEKEVTIGYQSMQNPWKIVIKQGIFERDTGYKINWKKFSSGASALQAVASGDVQIAVAGSSPIAAGISRGVEAQLFWILEDIAAAEALVVRNGSGINSPQDLKGKKIGVPFVSTTHFHMMFALEQFGLSEKDVKLLNMQPNAIAAAWERGDIDAAFVWDPALARIKESGKVLITSGQLCEWGKCTFDGMIVDPKWAKENEAFMGVFVALISMADSNYRNNPKEWHAKSPMAKAIADLSGGKPEQVPETLALYKFPTLDEQLSPAWLGGGKDGGAARALQFTSEFLKGQKKIPSLQSNYGDFVTSKHVETAKKVLGQ